MNTLRMLLSFSILFVFVAGCHVEGPLGPTTCTGSADAFSCTTDVCDATSMAFVSIPVDANCGAGRFCRPSDPSHDSAGCVGTPPPVCAMSCDDGVACTRDYCDSGTCRHAADSSLCASGQVCDATDGCTGSGPPPAGFTCVYTNGANRIGYAIRVRASEMTGLRTIPDSTGVTQPMSGSHVRLWALGTSGAAIDDDASGWATYSLVGTPGGRINTHPFIHQWRIGDDPSWNRDILNVADLRGDVGRTCASLGYEVEVCHNPTSCASASDWAALPESFCVVGPDTVGHPFSDDPVIAPELRGAVATRLVIATSGSDSTATCSPVI